MKNTIFIFTLILITLSCKAQVIGTLEQLEECQRRPNRDDGCPDLENITYVKDTNNRLDQFVGTWKGSANGKQYEIKLEKKTNYKSDPSDKTSWDRIFGRMIVKNSSGTIIYNSMNKLLSEPGILNGDNFQTRVYVLSFVGNYSCLESGAVFIETKLNNPNEMTLFYSQDKDGLLNPEKCPNFSTFVSLLPHNKMILTKQ
ncbi:DUF6705 family protein [Chryseobacterium bernardetii]|uniref:DUF6705 family protein n=1 Tax=Chryseobacterium bernardetii TaxID=1241978 RepID=UPI003624518F